MIHHIVQSAEPPTPQPPKMVSWVKFDPWPFRRGHSVLIESTRGITASGLVIGKATLESEATGGDRILSRVWPYLVLFDDGSYANAEAAWDGETINWTVEA